MSSAIVMNSAVCKPISNMAFFAKYIEVMLTRRVIIEARMPKLISTYIHSPMPHERFKAPYIGIDKNKLARAANTPNSKPCNISKLCFLAIFWASNKMMFFIGLS